MGIAIQAQLEGCRTTKDGGWNLQFLTGQDQVQQIGILSELREENLYLVILTEAEYYANQSQGLTKE